MRDIGYGARQLVRAPVFALVAIVSVALGISGSVVVFTTANSILLRPLPGVIQPERLVALFYGGGGGTVWSYPDFEDAARDMPALSGAAAYSTSPVVVAGGDSARREVLGQRISANYFQVLGASLLLGRSFGPDDPRDAAIIGEQLWRRDFGGETDVLGRQVEIRSRMHTIVGVAPAGLLSPSAPAAPQVYYPIDDEDRLVRGSRSLDVIARMRDGASMEDVRAQAAVAAQRLFDVEPGLHRTESGEARPIQATPGRALRIPPGEEMTVIGGVGGALAVTAVILLVAATNLANMVLTRGLKRRGEIGIRQALGASRRGLVAQLATDCVLLSRTGGGLALFGV
jgi:hypothetical protein